MSELKVVYRSEYFGKGDEPVAFQYTRVLFQHEGEDELYQGLSKKRYQIDADVEEHDFYETFLIPKENLNPDFRSGFTNASHLEDEPGQWYTKRPNLSQYNPQEPDQLKNQILEEVGICEYLKKHPHPNIAVYHGCEVDDSRITGLCFTNYGQSLMERVNPMKYNKRMFSLKRGGGLSPEIRQWLHGIESGIRHLHSFGLVHNDINPANIMFDGDAPVIIDFGSCRLKGSDINMVGRTYEWYDDNVMVAMPGNDLDALEEIRLWLGGNVDNFKF